MKRLILIAVLCMLLCGCSSNEHDYNDTVTEINPTEIEFLTQYFDWNKSDIEKGLLSASELFLLRQYRAVIDYLTEEYPEDKFTVYCDYYSEHSNKSVFNCIRTEDIKVAKSTPDNAKYFIDVNVYTRMHKIISVTADDKS